jgi:hypothetical protein
MVAGSYSKRQSGDIWRKAALGEETSSDFFNRINQNQCLRSN